MTGKQSFEKTKSVSGNLATGVATFKMTVGKLATGVATFKTAVEHTIVHKINKQEI